MRKLIAPITFIFIIIFFVGNLSSRPEGADSGVFRIMTYEYAQPLGSLASSFRTRYNGEKTIEVIYYNGVHSSNEKGEYKKYISDLSNMLMNGTAPDVFYLPDELLLTMGRSGYVSDMYEFIEADFEFDRQDYYMNVLSAYEQKGKLPVIPLNYEGLYVAMRPEFIPKTVPRFDSLDQISIKQMIELYKSIPYLDREHYQIERNMNFSEALVKTDYLDIRNQSVNFTEDGFISLAEDFKQYGINVKDDITYEFLRNEDYTALDHTIIYSTEDDGEYSSYIFATFDGQPYKMLPYKPPYSGASFEAGPGFQGSSSSVGPSSSFTHYVPLVTDDGRHIIRSMSLIAINASSPNKDLAWEFIKYALDKQKSSQESYYMDTVNKKNHFQALYDSLLSFNDEFMKVPVTDEMKKDFQGAVDFLIKNADKPKFAMYAVTPADLSAVLDNYMLTDQSAYDLAVYMQNMMTTFFEERD